MMYSRVFTLFVSLICVTSSLAAPSVAHVGATVGAVARADDAELLPRQQSSVLQIFQDLTTQGTPFINNMKTAVADPSNVDADSLQTNLQNIIDLLSSSHGQLQTMSKGPTTAAQSSVSAVDVVAVVGPVLQLLLTVLALVVGVVGRTPLGLIVLPLVATIGTLLAAVIHTALGLVTGLLFGLIPILLTLTAVLDTLGFTAILALLIL
ncbi:hypothetical protein BJ912DRAFT_1063492 [Pholiota molesta]|nr:hypothetical protein BJ912DRAFT_1063492 [Pholiota molesta]